ncbi:TetR/AcrR family transcriptional regulator [Pendulispora brunnea]|uniref:TetR/AcrR family transcriptional regulator n=1 Tax=Pendulispora brunnea TaxID=2905690 RepID=A0ABZ2KHB2_9BACT
MSSGTGKQAPLGKAPRPLRRGRGRPPASAPAGDDLREHVIAASAHVYAEHGYRHTTVERILEAAGISRPTFYRLFSDRRDVIEALVARANDLLYAQVLAAAEQQRDLRGAVVAAVDAYFEWGLNLGPMVGAIYNEIHDPESPASSHRARVIARMIALFDSIAAEHGRPRLDPIFWDALVCAAEHAASGAFWPKRRPPAEIERRRAVVLRILLASLASPRERVPPLPLYDGAPPK